MTCHALIQGGNGPDEWTRSVEVEGVDIVEAARKARAKANAMGGAVVRIEQAE